MKKILLVSITLLLLCGCSGGSHDSFVSEADTVIFARPDGSSYTKGDLYESMKQNDISVYLSNDIVTRLAGFEGIDMDAIREEAETDAQAAIDAGQEYYLIYYYGSVENYIEEMIPYKALNGLCKQAVEKDFNTYVNDYHPYKAEIVYFDDMEAAENVLSDVEKGSTFAYACTANGYTGAVEETVYTDNDSDLPLEVKDYVLNSEAGLSGIIQSSTTITDADGNSVINPRYYLVNLVSRDVEEFRDEFVDIVVNDIDQATIINNLLNKYEISIHDQRAFDLLSAMYEAVK